MNGSLLNYFEIRERVKKKRSNKCLNRHRYPIYHVNYQVEDQ